MIYYEMQFNNIVGKMCIKKVFILPTGISKQLVFSSDFGQNSFTITPVD